MFRVWCPDDGETEADAWECTTWCADAAAEEWAEYYHETQGEAPDGMVVSVRDDAVGLTTRHRISIEVVPQYNATILRDEDGGDDNG